MEYTITKNAEFGSLEVRFDEKPADTVRLALKRLKMRWHGVNKCWYGYASESAIVAAILENAPGRTARDGLHGWIHGRRRIVRQQEP